MICQLTLFEADALENCNTAIVPTKDAKDQILDNIRGNTLAPAINLIDPDDQKRKYFFVFSDLAVKTQGNYKLVARLIDTSKYSWY